MGCTHTHAYTHASHSCMRSCMHDTYINTCMHTCKHAILHTYISVPPIRDASHACMQAYMHTAYLHANMHASHHIHTRYVDMCMHACTLARIHELHTQYAPVAMDMLFVSANRNILRSDHSVFFFSYQSDKEARLLGLIEQKWPIRAKQITHTCM